MGILKYISDKLYSNDKEVALVNGLGQATAWASVTIISNSEVVIDDSYNVAGIVNNYMTLQVTFETPMDNANYAIFGLAKGTSNGPLMKVSGGQDPTTTGFHVYAFMLDNTVAPPESIQNAYIVVFGGKNV